ncbi:DUF3108 domain-containing protein [Candidatus Poribacteria bacterium]|nr:DUF3108 domain-containing protein [Candidatus Poribacteria bacterium]
MKGFISHKKIIIFIFAISVWSSTMSVLSAQPLLEQPTIWNGKFKSGEELEYNVKVRGIPAGTQVMKIDGNLTWSGNNVYHVKSESKITRLFSLFYSFDNRSESFIDSTYLHPLYYSRKIIDGGYKGRTIVDFDQKNQIARVVKDKKYKEIEIPTGIQDELSMIYLLRSKDIEVGQSYKFPALIGTEIIDAKVSVLRYEKVDTDMGKIKTIVVKTTPKNIVIWLTDDAARIPVKIEADSKLGKIVFKLEHIR